MIYTALPWNRYRFIYLKIGTFHGPKSPRNAMHDANCYVLNFTELIGRYITTSLYPVGSCKKSAGHQYEIIVRGWNQSQSDH